ncbi:hypothetical protein ASE99_04360 [Serratia sp. Leaf51]|nr:hypothetical protein ASE99_04360 [Serratia sp. Leaf51]
MEVPTIWKSDFLAFFFIRKADYELHAWRSRDFFDRLSAVFINHSYKFFNVINVDVGKQPIL